MQLATNLNSENVYEITVRGLLSGGTHGVEASVVPILGALTTGCFVTWRAWRGEKPVTMQEDLTEKYKGEISCQPEK